MTAIYRYAFLQVALLCLFLPAIAAAGELPATLPGEHFPLSREHHKDAESFEQGQPIVGTTYFYWYDIESNSHIIDGDGSDALTTHPADMQSISYKRAAWHETQLRDMLEAGIDFLLPVYWGVPGKYDGWSFAGLPPLLQAHDALQKQGLSPPKIGLFYDTSILKWNRFNKDGTSYHVDLSTDFGKQWFYTAARDFFSLIPPAKWARVDGGPIIFLYSVSFAKKQDSDQLEYLRRRFRQDFATDIFLVKQPQWQGRADAVYSWGGAVNGPIINRRVAALGPGYDHSAVPGRRPLVVERQDGKTYVDRWTKLLQLGPDSRPWMVHIETWNEWHEGTDVAHSREYGRSYIVLTKLFSDMWRAKTWLRIPGSYADAREVSWRPGEPNGLRLRPSSGDGVWKTETRANVTTIVSAANPHSEQNRYLYFDVDDVFAYGLLGRTVAAHVTFQDAGCSAFRIEYDSTNPHNGSLQGAFRPTDDVSIQASGKWRTAELALTDCRFAGRCNGADFRIAVFGGDLELAVRKVTLTKKPSPPAAP